MDYTLLMKEQLDKMESLFKAAQAESRDLTEDEQKQYNAAEKEYKRLEAAKAKADDLAAKAAKVKADADAKAKADADAKAHVPASNASAKAHGDDVKAGDDLKAKKPYANLGEMLADVARTKTSNAAEAMERLVKAQLNTETGADGGFLVPEEFFGNMMEQAVEQSNLFSRATELTLSVGNTANIPGVDESSRADGSRYGGISVNWVKEGGSGTYSKPAFRNLDIKLSKLVGLVKITDEMLEDSALLSSWVQQAYPAEMAFALDQAVFDGDGNGKPLGVMNSNALVTVAKEGSQAADTIVYENVIKMWARMPARRAANAAWFITQQALEQLPLMNLSVGTGGAPVYLPAGGASATPYSTLLGMPVIPIEQAAALGDLGDILLADMSDYIAIVKGGIKTASSIHVDFDKAITAFRFIKRVNGAPYTRTSLASRANSSFLTSPYITLAERAA